MARGRQTRALSEDQITRLRDFQCAGDTDHPSGLTDAELLAALGKPFSVRRLQMALRGEAIWDRHHAILAEWIDRYLASTATNNAPHRESGQQKATTRRPEGNRSVADALAAFVGRGRSAQHAVDEEITNAERRETDERNKEEVPAARTVRGSR